MHCSTQTTAECSFRVMAPDDLYEEKVSNRLDSPPVAHLFCLNDFAGKLVDGSFEGNAKQGCYKTEFETVN